MQSVGLAAIGNFRARHGAIHRDQHLRRGELVEAFAEALEMAFAAELLAWQAGLRVLHHPDIAPVLNGAGSIPRPGKTADRPRTDQTRAGRAVERDGRSAARRCEM